MILWKGIHDVLHGFFKKIEDVDCGVQGVLVDLFGDVVKVDGGLIGSWIDELIEGDLGFRIVKGEKGLDMFKNRRREAGEGGLNGHDVGS
nr:MAG TPA: hypothetical protein [Caudoviricetes sp.]